MRMRRLWMVCRIQSVSCLVCLYVCRVHIHTPFFFSSMLFNCIQIINAGTVNLFQGVCGKRKRAEKIDKRTNLWTGERGGRGSVFTHWCNKKEVKLTHFPHPYTFPSSISPSLFHGIDYVTWSSNVATSYNNKMTMITQGFRFIHLITVSENR